MTISSTPRVKITPRSAWATAEKSLRSALCRDFKGQPGNRSFLLKNQSLVLWPGLKKRYKWTSRLEHAQYEPSLSAGLITSTRTPLGRALTITPAFQLIGLVQRSQDCSTVSAFGRAAKISRDPRRDLVQQRCQGDESVTTRSSCRHCDRKRGNGQPCGTFN